MKQRKKTAAKENAAKERSSERHLLLTVNHEGSKKRPGDLPDLFYLIPFKTPEKALAKCLAATTSSNQCQTTKSQQSQAARLRNGGELIDAYVVVHHAGRIEVGRKVYKANLINLSNH